MTKRGKKIAGVLALSLIFLPLFYSCSSNSEKKSFNSALDSIDALINQRLYREAVAELLKAEKDARGSWAQIGIFRRYRLCEENERAEKFLVKSLKKNPENLELIAVYTNFLLREDRISDALTAGKKLSGTKYGSIYSEAVMRDVIEKTRGEEKAKVFKNKDYYSVYYDAWTGSGDNAWLRNCALFHLMNGSYGSASEIKPSEVFDSSDSYFWALVSFDAKRFGDAVNYLETAKKLLKNKLKAKERETEWSRISILEADSLTALRDEEGAQKIREEFISSLETTPDGWLVPQNEYSFDAAYLFTNSARWEFDNEKDEEGKRTILFAVNTWPDFVPALSLYSSFAYQSSLVPDRDYVELSLSDSGYLSLDMERFDNRVTIPVSDAVFRIEESIKRTNDPLLYIILLDLKYKTDKSLNDKEKIADLWNVLEKNAVSPSVYPPLMLDYALSFLLNHKDYDDAYMIFYRYVCAKYGIPLTEDFFLCLIEKVHELEPVVLEYASYFSALKNRADDTLLLHQLLIFEENGYADAKIMRPAATDASCVNLAMIYASLNQQKEALDLYGKTFGRCTSLKLKSEIMLRMAEIYTSMEDIKNARRCAEYAVSLNKSNVEARMLLVNLGKR